MSPSPITNHPDSAKARERLGKAKAALILEQPFFASLVCSVPMHECETLNPPTMATDGKQMWFHPEFIASLTGDEAKFVLCHEVGHAVFAHMFRRGHRDPLKWNIAGDYIINQLLSDENVGVRPKDCFFNPALVRAGGGTTEGVFDLLPDDAGKGGGKGQGPPGGGGWDDCRDSGGSPAQVSADQATMKVKVAQAAAAAKMCGNMSQRLEQFVDAALKAKVDWRDVLRRFVSQRAKVEYTYAQPKRRWLAEDIYLPALSGQSLGEILIAVDQSGSVSEAEVADFKAEILAIHADTKPKKTHVFYFDSEVARTETYEPDDAPDIRRYTTGGTAFSPIFAKAAELDLDPACCVVLTDLCCSDFGDAPHYPVLWVTTMAEVAPWGQIVPMKPKGL